MNTLRLEGVGGRDLRPVSAEFNAGMHVVLTHDNLGHAELFALLSGTTPPRRGQVMLRQRRPCRDPELRSHIGSLWPVERFAEAVSADRSLRVLGFSTARIESIRQIAESLQAPTLFGGPPQRYAPAWHQLLALAIALSTVDPYALLLHEPLTHLSRTAQSFLLERLLTHSKRIPVLLLTANAALAEHLGGPAFELSAGYIRPIPPTQTDWHLVRVTGVGLRNLNGELSKRPSLRSVRFVAEPPGQEVLWLETRDSRQLSLDIVRIARELEIRLLSIQTTAVMQ